MKNKVISELCAFLNALPQQILLWDKKVVDFLVQHPDIFARFQDGCHYTKWDIYQSIKHG
jgi:hypothetical protein